MSRSSTPERRRRERRRLWKHQNGKCHWCQVDMIMAYSGRAHVNGKKPHPKLATIDHLHPKGPSRARHARWREHSRARMLDLQSASQRGIQAVSPARNAVGSERPRAARAVYRGNSNIMTNEYDKPKRELAFERWWKANYERPPTDIERSMWLAGYWRAQIDASEEINRLRNDIQELTCGDPRLVSSSAEPREQQLQLPGPRVTSEDSVRQAAESSRPRELLVSHMEPDTSPLTHQEIFSAVHHHAAEIVKLTAAVPAQCTRAASRDADHCDYPDCEQHWTHVVAQARALLEPLADCDPAIRQWLKTPDLPKLPGASRDASSGLTLSPDGTQLGHWKPLDINAVLGQPSDHPFDAACACQLCRDKLAEWNAEKSSPADLVGALQDVVHTDPGPVRAGSSKREWNFDRYRGGKLMAQGVKVHAPNYADAYEKAMTMLFTDGNKPTDELRLSERTSE